MNRKMKWAYAGLVALPSTVLFFSLLPESRTEINHEFCAICGFERTTTYREVFGRVEENSVVYKDNEHHRQYRRFVSRKCTHQWYLVDCPLVWQRWKSISVVCGVGPPYLNEPALRQLSRLKPDQVKTILASILAPSSSDELDHRVSVIRRFAKVRKGGEQAWWHQKAALFGA